MRSSRRSAVPTGCRQFLVWHGLKPFESLTTALILAAVPYVILRGLANRLISLGQSHSKSTLTGPGQVTENRGLQVTRRPRGKVDLSLR